MLEIKIFSSAVMYRYACVGAVRCTQNTLLALLLDPLGSLAPPLTGLGESARTGLIYLASDSHILPGDILIYILCFYHLISVPGLTLYLVHGLA